MGSMLIGHVAPLTAQPSPTTTPHATAFTLPHLGDGGDMGLGEERRLGDQIARSLYRDPDYFDDPQLETHLETIWKPLLQSAQQRGELPPDAEQRYAWRLLLVRDPSINAFALPGGYLGVHLGLIAATSSSDELASVLAHELSHISQRHIARLLTQQSRQAPWMLASMVVGMLAASKAKNADIGSAAMVGGQALAMQTQLNFSRDMEREADRIGFGVMTDAGFDGRAFVSLFGKLEQASHLNDSGAFPYLRSHPLSTERMADMRSRQLLSLTETVPTAVTSPVQGEGQLMHAFMAARARVLAETRIERLQALADAGRQLPVVLQDANTLGIRYAAVLAAAKLRDASTVAAQLQRLSQGLSSEAPAHTVVKQLALETMLMTGSAHLGTWTLSILRDQALASNDRVNLLLAARAAVAQTEPGVWHMAHDKLQTWLALHPDDAAAWQQLATVAQAQGLVVQAARASAEAQQAQLDLQGALDRMRAAQTLAKRTPQLEHTELSIIDARTHTLERLVREQWCEEREQRAPFCQTQH